jgi:hypothetical protein
MRVPERGGSRRTPARVRGPRPARRRGCRRLVGHDAGTAGDRRWSTVTALLGDAPSTLARFSSPLCTVVEAASYLAVPASTLTSRATGYRRARAGHADPFVPRQRRGHQTIAGSVIGLDEAGVSPCSCGGCPAAWQAGPRLRRRTGPAPDVRDELDREDDESDDEHDVDERADDVQDQPEQPETEQDGGDGPQQGGSCRCRVRWRGSRRPHPSLRRSPRPGLLASGALTERGMAVDRPAGVSGLLRGG